MYTRNTVVAVRPFLRQPDGEEVIIGNAQTGVFLAVPVEAVELLDHLAQGKSVGEVSDLYQQKHGETPDMDDFLGLLATKGIVEPVAAESDGTEGVVRASVESRRLRYHFSNFPQQLARRLFSYPVWAGCFAVIALALWIVGRNPSLLPAPRDLYFPDRRALSLTLLVAASYVTIFLHELAHLIAARAAGVNSRMGISYRLWYLVAETDLTGLWAVPKRQRYMPMLAGMLLDAVSAALLMLVLFADQKEWLSLSPFWVRLLRATGFTYGIRILWQFFLFVRTDLYYVIASLFNCRNLLGDTGAFLRNQVSRVIPWVRPIDQSGVPAAERRFIRLYAVLWVAGRLWAVFTLFWVTVPVGISYLRDVVNAFRVGYSTSPGDFADALIAASYFLVPTIAGIVLWIGGTFRQERI
jgi:putative peptide zinc metalloprotease protein